MKTRAVNALLVTLVYFSFNGEISGQESPCISYNYPRAMADEKQEYYISVLTLILNASKEKFGSYVLCEKSIDMLQERASTMVEKRQEIDITWRITSVALEERLQAIYFPLLKGLMGARIFIIRKADASFYSHKTSLEQLKQKKLGQGLGWADEIILKANGFSVATGNAQLLITMLINNRFDLFPRAFHEPWVEIEGKNDLMVEPNLLLFYQAPMYFFVNKHNTLLIERLKYGVNKVVVTGEFDQFFYQHALIKNALSKLNIDKRKIFYLDNPYLSEESERLTHNQMYWLNLSALKGRF